MSLGNTLIHFMKALLLELLALLFMMIFGRILGILRIDSTTLSGKILEEFSEGFQERFLEFAEKYLEESRKDSRKN